MNADRARWNEKHKKGGHTLPSIPLLLYQGRLKKGRALNLRPIGVAVLDARGVLVAYSGEDGGGLFRPGLWVAELRGQPR